MIKAKYFVSGESRKTILRRNENSIQESSIDYENWLPEKSNVWEGLINSGEKSWKANLSACVIWSLRKLPILFHIRSKTMRLFGFNETLTQLDRRGFYCLIEGFAESALGLGFYRKLQWILPSSLRWSLDKTSKYITQGSWCQ